MVDVRSGQSLLQAVELLEKAGKDLVLSSR